MKKEIIKVVMVTIVINIFMIVLSYSILRDLRIKQDKLKIVYEKLIEESNF